jgi:hypothetical protein
MAHLGASSPPQRCYGTLQFALSGKADMQDGNARLPIRSRPWRIIAQQLSVETKPERISELCDELTNAMNEQLGRINGPVQDGHSRIPPRPAKS